MGLFWLDRTFMLLIPAFFLAIYAQSKVKRTYARYSQVRNHSGLTGEQVARRLLDSSGMGDVEIERIEGNLTDHYDPRKRVLRLSEGVYGSQSVAALGIAAHESGHAMQHSQGYVPIKLRAAVVPVASFGSSMAFPLFFIGLIFSSFKVLMDVGIFFFVGAVLFHLVTLPVELNASGRAIKVLSSGGYLVGDELRGARAVLTAAAWTYVAAATMAVTQLLRMLILRNMRD
jgi:Zn-dependent membrane protease YugP